VKAVLWREPLPAADPRALVDAEVQSPAAPGGHDLLVRVEAVQAYAKKVAPVHGCGPHRHTVVTRHKGCQQHYRKNQSRGPDQYAVSRVKPGILSCGHSV